MGMFLRVKYMITRLIATASTPVRMTRLEKMKT